MNTDLDSETSSPAVGIYGVNKAAPFKTISASRAVHEMVPPRKAPRLPSLIQFSTMSKAEEFKELARDDEGKPIEELGKLPCLHLIHPQVFIGLEGRRQEWEASSLRYKLISLYEEKDEEASDAEDGKGPRNMEGIYQLLTFLWAASKQQCGNTVALRDILGGGTITSICKRKALALNSTRPGSME